MNPDKLSVGMAVLGMVTGIFGSVTGNFLWWQFEEMNSKRLKWFGKYLFGSFSLVVFLIFLIIIFRIYSSI